jgi:pimeloyl-ACP methyl ester carboxylesterase
VRKVRLIAVSRNDYIALHAARMSRPGMDEIQITLFIDYQTNLERYDTWHAYLRQSQPKTLIVWGKNDFIFTAAGALAYQRDLPNAEVHLLDGGHFALEEHCADIANHIKRVFGSSGTPTQNWRQT